MKLVELFQQQEKAILEESVSMMGRSHLKSYEGEGPKTTEQRLTALLRLVRTSVQERSLGPVIGHATKIAEERFNAGYDLSEIQTAFNVLEEVVWKRIIRDIPPSDYAEALGLLGTVLGAGKDALARTYVSLAARTKAPSLNLRELFA